MESRVHFSVFVILDRLLKLSHKFLRGEMKVLIYKGAVRG